MGHLHRDEIFLEIVADVLQDICEVRQVSPFRLSQEIGCSPNAVYNWMKKKTEMPLYYAMRLAVVYQKFLLKLFREMQEQGITWEVPKGGQRGRPRKKAVDGADSAEAGKAEAAQAGREAAQGLGEDGGHGVGVDDGNATDKGRP